MRGYQKCAQLYKVTVFGILDVDHAPWILPPTHFLASHLQDGVAPDDSERNGGLQLPVLLLKVLVLVGVAFGKLVQLDMIVLEVLQDALLQLAHLLLVEAVRLANDQDDVHLAVQSSDQVQVHLAQAASGFRKD